MSGESLASCSQRLILGMTLFIRLLQIRSDQIMLIEPTAEKFDDSSIRNGLHEGSGTLPPGSGQGQGVQGLSWSLVSRFCELAGRSH